MGLLSGKQSQIFEHAGLAEHGHENHHAEQERQGVEVNGLQRLSVRIEAYEKPGSDHDGCTNPRGDGSVNDIGHDRKEGDQEDESGDPGCRHAAQCSPAVSNR